jgi:hypothetical protein
MRLERTVRACGDALDSAAIEVHQGDLRPGERSSAKRDETLDEPKTRPGTQVDRWDRQQRYGENSGSSTHG